MAKTLTDKDRKRIKKWTKKQGLGKILSKEEHLKLIKGKKILKKPYKIVKTDLFKQQEKKLPPKVRKEVKIALKNIAKNPTKAPNSMSLFGPPSAEELKLWMSRVKTSTIDLVFEYLNDKGCLNKKGHKLAQEFWDRYIREK